MATSKHLEGLTTGFKANIIELLERLRKANVVMIPYEGIRTPQTQAKLWRQSRSTRDVQDALARMKEPAPWLASVLDGVGPCNGPHVTNALPGNSWHQWGLAVDCYWADRPGHAEWSVSKGGRRNGYRLYGAEAARLGLMSLGEVHNWDWPHVQQPVASAPTSTKGWAAIDAAMKERFG